jgi:hypothetical protein
VNGADLIYTERIRQIEEEGRTPEHDAAHRNGELTRAAIAYAAAAVNPQLLHGAGGWWPWTAAEFKPDPNDPVRSLVKAGALIAAEIDRLYTAAGMRESAK